MGKYRKFYVALALAAAIAGLTAAGSAMGDDVISRQEWITIALAVLGALAVYLVPNDPNTENDLTELVDNE